MVIEDVTIGFGRMVVIALKWTLATTIASLILLPFVLVIFFAMFALFGTLILGVLAAAVPQ